MTAGRFPTVLVGRSLASRLIALGAGASLLTLGGCSASASAEVSEPLPRSQLLWVTAAPAGPLEADPWVRAVRAAELAQVQAWNSGDLDDPALGALWGDQHVESERERMAQQIRSGDLTVELGPRPFAPLLVQVLHGGTRAKVRGCADRPQIFGWVSPYFFDISSYYPAPYVYELVRNTDGTIRMHGSMAMEFEMDDDTTSGEPNLRTLPDGTELTLALCRTLAIPRGVLDPPPDLHRLLRMDPDLFHREEPRW